jgi:hypothetical protein
MGKSSSASPLGALVVTDPLASAGVSLLSSGRTPTPLFLRQKASVFVKNPVGTVPEGLDNAIWRNRPPKDCCA